MTGTFTGTRMGMTMAQQSRLRWITVHLLHCGLTDLNHGCCEGADREAHEIFRSFHRHGWPSNVAQAKWAEEHQEEFLEIRPVAKNPIGRNHEMVDRSQVVIATPATRHERLRGSGTWATIRYARKMNRWLIIVWPDGQTTEIFR